MTALPQIDDTLSDYELLDSEDRYRLLIDLGRSSGTSPLATNATSLPPQQITAVQTKTSDASTTLGFTMTSFPLVGDRNAVCHRNVPPLCRHRRQRTCPRRPETPGTFHGFSRLQAWARRTVRKTTSGAVVQTGANRPNRLPRAGHAVGPWVISRRAADGKPAARNVRVRSAATALSRDTTQTRQCCPR